MAYPKEITCINQKSFAPLFSVFTLRQTSFPPQKQNPFFSHFCFKDISFLCRCLFQFSIFFFHVLFLSHYNPNLTDFINWHSIFLRKTHCIDIDFFGKMKISKIKERRITILDV